MGRRVIRDIENPCLELLEVELALLLGALHRVATKLKLKAKFESG